MSLSRSAKQVLGFTLIELLIVVAIIAILAAIAVPNFLEAQTRAKVSRVVSDQRSIATALEAYMVDTRGYPLSDVGQDNAASPDYTPNPSRAGQVANLGFWMNKLTSPNSYLTSLPFDAFSKTRALPAGTSAKRDRFKLYTGNDSGDGESGATGRFGKRTGWALVSLGPNQDLMVRNLGEINDVKGSLSFMILAENLNSSPNLYVTCIMPYDSSNGTNSAGNVVKVGGTGTEKAVRPDYASYGTNN